MVQNCIDDYGIRKSLIYNYIKRRANDYWNMDEHNWLYYGLIKITCKQNLQIFTLDARGNKVYIPIRIDRMYPIENVWL